MESGLRGSDEVLRFYKSLTIFLLALMLLLGWLLWSAVRARSPVQLGNGYRYFSTEAGVFIDCVPANAREDNVRLTRAAKRAERAGVEFTGLPKAGPSVDAYHVYSRIIAGHVAPARRKNSFGDPIHWPQGGPPGYFVIDKQEDIIYPGLGKREWLRKLRGFGVRGEPTLYAPSIHDTILGRNRPDD